MRAVCSCIAVAVTLTGMQASGQTSSLSAVGTWQISTKTGLLGTLQVNADNGTGWMISSGTPCPTLNPARITLATLFPPGAVYVYFNLNGSAVTLMGNGGLSIGQYTLNGRQLENFTGSQEGAPSLTALVNAASFSGPPSPGSIASLFGQRLSSTASTAPGSIPLPLQLSGTSLCIGTQQVPLWYSSPSQINFQVPTETTAGAKNIVATTGGISAVAVANIQEASPAVFTYSTNRAVAVNVSDGSLNDSAHPAKVNDIITVYMTGIGPVDHPVQTNTAASTTLLSRATSTAAASIGGAPAVIQFLGLTPATIGLAQANIVIPVLPAGDYPLALTVDNVASNSAIVSVRAN